MTLLIVACLVAVATARPETGYSYPSPSNTYIQNSGSSGFPSGNSAFISGSSGFTSGNSGFISGSSGLTSGNNGFTTSSGFISGLNQATNFDYSTSSQVPLIHKHIYVHVAPPEPEVQQRQVIAQSAAPQKHYKIVFIKAPSFPTPSTPVISSQAQNQEKTLIYVLVKRPEDAPQISIPTVAPTQPNKPEVYFIKYKTRYQYEDTSLSGPSLTAGSAGDNGPPDPNYRGAMAPPPSSQPSQSYGVPGNSGPY